MSNMTDSGLPEGEKHAMELQAAWLCSRHIPRVLEIEHQSHPFPSSEKELRQSNKRSSTVIFCAISGDGPVGYASYVRHHWGYMVTRFGVGAKYRGCGVGGWIEERLREKLVRARLREVRYLVPEVSLGMQTFLRSRGYWVSHVERDAWEGVNGPRDCYHFTWRVE